MEKVISSPTTGLSLLAFFMISMLGIAATTDDTLPLSGGAVGDELT